MKRILLLTTGGTIASDVTENGLAPQLTAGKAFDGKEFSFGLQRMLWGFMKKMVIANVLAPWVKDVFANYCRITGHRSEEYWEATNDMPSAYLMGKIQSADKKALESALQKIGMREYLFALYDRVKQ